jgi:hypothetical protein
MRPTKLEVLKHILKDLDVSIAKHKHDDPNKVLEELMAEKSKIEECIHNVVTNKRKSHERREETHLHE